MTAKDLKGRRRCWSLNLQEYDFLVKYLVGKAMVVADAVSKVVADAMTTTSAQVVLSCGQQQLTDAVVCDHKASSLLRDDVREQGKAKKLVTRE